ncbi:hypothetical protein [Leptolyngbya sp. FACHB-261]|uniref:hypothetical protein n=1 Tax=Leptolyngbya sp. FACHB-261 TaxID=2692806 RepID=UPI0016877A0F|nr:hypothetical protein [Leptolyngbya sp. FACHB-261]MBD2104398.1 hypothetical protein [Leptolyngbya sp. FACHB-261]
MSTTVDSKLFYILQNLENENEPPLAVNYASREENDRLNGLLRKQDTPYRWVLKSTSAV